MFSRACQKSEEEGGFIWKNRLNSGLVPNHCAGMPCQSRGRITAVVTSSCNTPVVLFLSLSRFRFHGLSLSADTDEQAGPKSVIVDPPLFDHHDTSFGASARCSAPPQHTAQLPLGRGGNHRLAMQILRRLMQSLI